MLHHRVHTPVLAIEESFAISVGRVVHGDEFRFAEQVVDHHCRGDGLEAEVLREGDDLGFGTRLDCAFSRTEVKPLSSMAS